MTDTGRLTPTPSGGSVSRSTQMMILFAIMIGTFAGIGVGVLLTAYLN